MTSSYKIIQKIFTGQDMLNYNRLESAPATNVWSTSF